MSFLRTNTLRLKSCSFLEQTILNHGQRVAETLGQTLGALVGESVALPDFWALQLFFLESLRTMRGRMETAEEAHVKELADDVEPRNRREGSDAQLRSRMRQLRDFFAGAFQPMAVEELGFPRRLGKSPEELLRQGAHLIEVLKDPAKVLPAPFLGQVTLLLSEIADSLKPLVEDLRVALTDVGRETKEAALTLLDRNRAIKEYDQMFGGIARTLESLYRLAGEPELADQVRPSVRRPGRTANAAKEEEASEGGEGNEPAPAEPVTTSEA
ncbi:MAG: hypothetical protein GY719_17210 [bacterium]|nr:hypothetical protein [bacterium]